MKRLSVILGLLLIVAGAQATVRLIDESALIPTADITAAAVAWGDVDRDGRPDLLVGDGGENGSILYLNRVEGFFPANVEYDISLMTRVRSVQFVDYDTDGRLDVFCLSNDVHTAHLYRQTANHRFQEITLLPESQTNRTIESAAWTDMDGDGDLDLLLSNLPDAPVVAWLQQEGNDFVQIRGGSFPIHEGAASAVCVVDFDRDNDLDILLGYSEVNRQAKLYRNEGDRYIPWHDKITFPTQCAKDGAAWADIDNDQYIDLILPGSDHDTYLLKSIPKADSRGFADITASPGFLAGVENSRYVHCADLNMDGYQDLVVVPTGNQPARVVTNVHGESWSTQLITWNSGHHRPTTMSCALADYDGDGDEDIVLAEGSDGLRLMRNDTKDGHEWIALALLNMYGAPLPDCQVMMKFEMSKQLATTSAVTSSTGQNGQVLCLVSSNEDKSASGELIVDWPNGASVTYPFTALRLNQLNYFTEPVQQPEASAPPQTDEPLALSNAPNPFNPTTTVSFTLPANDHVKLAVYDLLGREAAVLADAPYAAGTYTLTFNASNLPSGVYFARLTTATETKLHRMLLIK